MLLRSALVRSIIRRHLPLLVVLAILLPLAACRNAPAPPLPWERIDLWQARPVAEVERDFARLRGAYDRAWARGY